MQASHSSPRPGHQEGRAAPFGGLELLMMVVSVVIALIGIGIAYLFYVKNPALPKQFAENFRGLYRLVFNKYYIDRTL
jgi:NADH:ubiquinone oxidoreductase subunit 5 (subunit L)/multisubunit Na+/H+ antiporter MnhA subunit